MTPPGKCGKRGCGSWLEHRTDALGRVVSTCPGCARVARGVCQDCPAALPVKVRRGGQPARRCPDCRAARDREHNRVGYVRRYHDPAHDLARRERARRRTEAVRAKARAKKAAEFAAMTVKERAARAEALRERRRQREAADPALREARLAYHRALYAKQREQRLAYARAYHHGEAAA